jgi:hypothetical protein
MELKKNNGLSVTPVTYKGEGKAQNMVRRCISLHKSRLISGLLRSCLLVPTTPLPPERRMVILVSVLLHHHRCEKYLVHACLLAPPTTHLPVLHKRYLTCTLQFLLRHCGRNTIQPHLCILAPPTAPPLPI